MTHDTLVETAASEVSMSNFVVVDTIDGDGYAQCYYILTGTAATSATATSGGLTWWAEQTVYEP